MADIQQIYSILLARDYQDHLFSRLQGKRKKQKGGREILVDCPFCHKEGHFSYSTEEPVWKCWSCGEGGDWIRYMEKAGGTFQQALQALAEAAGVELPARDQAAHQAYTRRADILEAAQDIFEAALHDPSGPGQPVLKYLQARGYSLEDIAGMELGAFLSRKQLQTELQKQSFTPQEIQASGLLTPGFGEEYKLTLLWRDQAGRAIGIVGRPLTDDKQELESRGLSKYKYSAGMEKDQGLIGFSSARKSSQVILVEGVLDALYLNKKGFKVVALGGTSLSEAQLQALKTVGVRELLLALDMDKPGREATERLSMDLEGGTVRAYVISLPEGFKDPDELIRAKGPEAFQESLKQAESGSRWMASRILSKYDTATDRGLDQALEEAISYGEHIHDPIEARRFWDALRASTGLSQADLELREELLWGESHRKATEARLQQAVGDIQSQLKEGFNYGRIQKILEGLQEGLRDGQGADLPQPYLLEDLTADIKTTPPALATGYKKLDETGRIPVGAITIIAGRPGHGKTTLQLNLLVNMLRAYPSKKFYFFSYEEARKAIATKIIMLLAGETLQAQTNYGAYVNYLQEKRGKNTRIEQAIKEYEQLTSSGRLLISDQMYPAEQLAPVIGKLAKAGEVGAVVVDYIQRIPLLKPSQGGQRYLDIKQISGLLLEQAVSCDIALILGAQLNRASMGRADRKPKLEDMRESGDIEQDSSLVLGLYTEAVDKLESEDYQAPARVDQEVEMEIAVLKNRAGVAGRSYKLCWQRPVLKITDKTAGSSSSGDKKPY